MVRLPVDMSDPDTAHDSGVRRRASTILSLRRPRAKTPTSVPEAGSLMVTLSCPASESAHTARLRFPIRGDGREDLISKQRAPAQAQPCPWAGHVYSWTCHPTPDGPRSAPRRRVEGHCVRLLLSGRDLPLPQNGGREGSRRSGIRGDPRRRARNGNFIRRTFGPAAIGEPNLMPHGLRHTAASLAIAAGANVKLVQQMLGHTTASMTLDLYGHLFPDQLDDVADRLDVIGRAAAD
jgi:hypothetical protein